MRAQWWIATLATLGVLGPGCHAKFKKEAPTLGAVSTQAFVTGHPYAHLGRMYGADIASDVVNVVQAVREVDQATRIAQAVDLPMVNQALVDGFAEALGSGPPFAYDPGSGNVLQLEVDDYGLYVPYLGAPGEFTYLIRVRIYKADGDRVYKSRVKCTAGVGNPTATSVALDAVNNVKQLKTMTDGEVNVAFQDIAYWCGQEMVRKIRRHAG